MIRAQTRFGTLILGQRPLVVGTIASCDFLSALRPGSDLPCDVVEVRLDLIGENAKNWESAVRGLEAKDRPVIVTIRDAMEGGKWSGDERERVKLFERALHVATAVDVEFRSKSLSRVSELAVVNQKALIVSYHDFESTPPLDTLRDVIRIAPNYGTVVKIATMTRTDEDLGILRDLFRENSSASLCVLGMGPLSERARTEFPRLGSCFTYGYLDEPIAPGQPSARYLADYLGQRRYEGR
jgi:3-dehydroquinate dehydratase-1